jgi:hypothetical protein
MRRSRSGSRRGSRLGSSRIYDRAPDEGGELLFHLLLNKEWEAEPPTLAECILEFRVAGTQEWLAAADNREISLLAGTGLDFRVTLLDAEAAPSRPVSTRPRSTPTWSSPWWGWGCGP